MPTKASGKSRHSAEPIRLVGNASLGLMGLPRVPIGTPLHRVPIRRGRLPDLARLASPADGLFDAGACLKNISLSDWAE